MMSCASGFASRRRARLSAVVGSPEAGMPVGLVHAEHEGMRDAVAVCDLLELVVHAPEAVDVVSEMDVGVEDVGSLRQLALQLLVIGGEQRLSSLEHVLHRAAV